MSKSGGVSGEVSYTMETGLTLDVREAFVIRMNADRYEIEVARGSSFRDEQRVVVGGETITRGEANRRLVHQRLDEWIDGKWRNPGAPFSQEPEAA
jgi:hypothetical protein